MLEQVHFLIQRGEGETAWTIADAETNRPLGLARWRPWSGPLWLSWLAQPTLDVFENEDEPLVFTVRRLWGLSSKWEVRDADGQRIAEVRHGLVLDAFDQFWARLERSADGSTIRFLGHSQELARATWSEEGIRFAFAPPVESYPLVKMALLAVVLIA
jgi:hypothetical protein